MRELQLHWPDGEITHAVPREPLAIFPGSFDPLHDGHRKLAAVVGRKFGREIHFELSRTNVDKPELPIEILKARTEQFRGYAPLWVTRAAVFEEKSALFPGALFVVGFDTAIRLLDAKYYRDEAARETSLRTIAERGCRFVVGGRVDVAGIFQIWRTHGALFEVLTEEDFRLDIRSTELRVNTPARVVARPR